MLTFEWTDKHDVSIHNLQHFVNTTDIWNEIPTKT
jgi:hypothetical protein